MAQPGLAYEPKYQFSTPGGAQGIQSNFDSPRPTGARAQQMNSLSSTLGPEFSADAGIEMPDQGFDFSNAMGNFSIGAEGIAGLANAYNAWQQTGLMKDQLNMQKNMANRNIANQAAVTNRQLQDKASMAAQSLSNSDPGTPAYEADYKKQLSQVSGAPIA